MKPYFIERGTTVPAQYIITDLKGRAVIEETLTNSKESIDLSKCENGIYLLRTETRVIKLIKQ